MPIYEYKCGSCGETFEYSQRMADDPKTVCESCQGPLERLISRTAFQLKGSGWYKDLYSSPKPSGDKAAGGSDKSTGSDKSSSTPSSTSSDAGKSSTTPSTAPSTKSGAGGGKDG